MLDHPCGRHRLVGKLLTGLLSLVLLAAGAAKVLVTPPPEAPVLLPPAGVRVLALIDLLLVAGMWVPRLSTLSYVLTVGYFGGATATHLTRGEPWGLPAGLIAFTLLCAYFRSPELFLRLMGRESLGEGAACALPPRE